MIALPKLVPELQGLPEVQVMDLAIDSREVKKGDLFLALKGASNDGHDHVHAAVANGAIAVFAQRELEGLEVPCIVVDGLAARVSEIAGEFFGHPSRAMQCVAVTGTNGKTSVAHFIAELAAKMGIRSGFLGTTGWGLFEPGTRLAPSGLTTADAVALQKRLAQLQASGCELVAMELSSHALDQHRPDALFIDVALFTNLTRDHLDYHGSMSEYGAAKERLFRFGSLGGMAINVSDAFGAQLANRCAQSRSEDSSQPAKLLSLAYAPKIPGEDSASSASSATSDQLVISNLVSRTASKTAGNTDGMMWRLSSPWGTQDVQTSVIGFYNAVNLSLAIAALVLLGHKIQDVVAVVPEVSAPPGRLERVRPEGTEAGNTPSVYVDYAHTPDALESVLSAARAHCAGRLICVFGCGGDRDSGKRAPMGQAVHRLADIGFLTSDNPRFEDPLAIISDVEAGLPDGHKIFREPDRYRAIQAALVEASADDVVVIAGKGHEDYQDIKGVRSAFDDAKVAREILEASVSAGAKS